MNERHIARTAHELGLTAAQVQATADLLDEGASVPFVARYRKEATGSLDEVAIAAIRDRLAQLAALEDRRRAIVASLQERNLLSDDCAAGWIPPRLWLRWRTSISHFVPSAEHAHPLRANAVSNHWPIRCCARIHISMRSEKLRST